MNACEIPTPEMLSRAIHLHIEEEKLNFEEARHAAYERARTYGSDPMLLSWFERKSGTYFPSIVECCERGKPTWVSYAQSRGGNLTIDINDEDYIFIFRGRQDFA